jgi:hypothetical protein
VVSWEGQGGQGEQGEGGRFKFNNDINKAAPARTIKIARCNIYITIIKSKIAIALSAYLINVVI